MSPEEIVSFWSEGSLYRLPREEVAAAFAVDWPLTTREALYALLTECLRG